MPPKTVIVIGILAITWFVVRLYTRRIEERRAIEREERMARLFAEREALLARRDDEPNSLEPVVVRDVRAIQPPAKTSAIQPAVKLRCRACRALNDDVEKQCAACGAEL